MTESFSLVVRDNINICCNFICFKWLCILMFYLLYIILIIGVSTLTPQFIQLNLILYSKRAPRGHLNQYQKIAL